MVEDFSNGYCLWDTTVQEYVGEQAAVPERDYRELSAHVYGDDEPTSNAPLYVKIETKHIPVYGDADLPPETLAVPVETADELGLETLPATRGVLVAKGWFAKRVLSWF